MLEVASRFHAYSLNNLLLILWQRGDATRVAGYRKWREMGRQVRKGERGIRILAPVLRWVEDEDDNGAPVRVQRVVAFKAVSVFDVSQTEGAPLPDVDRPQLLTGEAPAGLWDALAEQVTERGFDLDRADCTPANGVTRWDTRTVTVRPDVDDAQAVKTLAHELAHVRLHEPAIVPFDHHRGLREVEAESVAYIVCRHFGLVTDDYSLPYVAHWSEGDGVVVRETAQRVTACARAVIAAVGHTAATPPLAGAAAA